MAYCSNCGNPLEGAGRFCRSCGSPVPHPTGTYSPQLGSYPTGAPQPPKQGGYLKWLLSGIGALVVVVAVVCVLVFVVFSGEDGNESAALDKDSAASAAASTTVPAVSTTVPAVAPVVTTEPEEEVTASPEQLLELVFAAMENHDVDTLLALMDPTLFVELPEGMTMEMVREGMVDELAAMGSMEFTGLEMSTEMTSDTTATVTLTAGVVTVTDAYGETTSDDVRDAGEPVTIDVVKVDGRWYLGSSPFL